MNHPASTQMQGVSDLTVIANIKPGLIQGIFDSRSHVWRLTRVLKLLDGARRKSRESDLQASPLVDNVARLRDIQFFRFSILPNVPGPDNAQLLLNVTFDGGWEPYMRLIWKPLGTLLDLIFCHCPDYPLAAASSFDTYIRWVRDHEVAGQFFYVDSGGTVADRAYLERLEALHRLEGDRPGADLHAAELALQPMQGPMPTRAAVLASINLLKGLHGLLQFFPGSAAAAGAAGAAGAAPVPLDDASVLLRFAQDMLSDLRQWIANGLFDPGREFDYLRASFETQREWLMKPRTERLVRADGRNFSPELVQSGILRSPRSDPKGNMRGALVLAEVVDPEKALNWLARTTTATKSGVPIVRDGTLEVLDEGNVSCNIALTHPGLKALGVQDRHLRQLPMEFSQGMDARAGILGDLRLNHPDHWLTPKHVVWHGQVNLSTVHLVFQLRTPEAEDEAEESRSLVLERLQKWIRDNLEPAAFGLEVLAREATWSQPASNGEPAARNHFGYVDGISQPQLQRAENPQHWDDSVKTGELFRGWMNDRGDGPAPHANEADPANQDAEWLKDSTFLVLRKLQQNVQTFDQIVARGANALMAIDPALSLNDARELVRAKLMGRSSDGTALTTQAGVGKGNDYSYRGDLDGRSCPFASHVRRTNPREMQAGGIKTPRILRRGMSYGEPVQNAGAEADRGVYFMAYNASIAEQFEVIQRWVSGGNSTGVSSAQADPFLRVPRPGESAVYTFTHCDQVVRVDLGGDPVCRLMWGLYAWVPSIEMLKNLKDLTAVAPVDQAQPKPKEPDPASAPDEAEKQANQRVKSLYEGDPWRRANWKAVQKDGGVRRDGRNVLVANLEFIKEVLCNDGATFSAGGYGERMGQTIGKCPFGQDDVGVDRGHEAAHVRPVKAVVADFRTEAQAYEEAKTIVSDYLQKLRHAAAALGQPVSVDFLELGQVLLVKLLRNWFVAVPADAEGPELPRDSITHLLTVARHVFSPRPNGVVTALAPVQGGLFRQAVLDWIARSPKPANRDSETLTRRLLDALANYKSVSPEASASIVANVMLGMPATLLGSWNKLMLNSLADRSLWKLQLALPGPDVVLDHAGVSAVLRPALVELMAQEAVADGIWRTVKGRLMLGRQQLEDGDIVWLGLAQALMDQLKLPGSKDTLSEAEEWLFGGNWTREDAPRSVHGCPGRSMAMGALLGAYTALLSAGQISTTLSPTVVVLRPFKPA